MCTLIYKIFVVFVKMLNFQLRPQFKEVVCAQL